MLFSKIHKDLSNEKKILQRFNKKKSCAKVLNYFTSPSRTKASYGKKKLTKIGKRTHHIRIDLNNRLLDIAILCSSLEKTCSVDAEADAKCRRTAAPPRDIRLLNTNPRKLKYGYWKWKCH
jgi:phosphoglycerate-specific signal transduction histidine kinase